MSDLLYFVSYLLPIYPYFHVSYCLNVSLFSVGWHLGKACHRYYGGWAERDLPRKCMDSLSLSLCLLALLGMYAHGHGALVKKTMDGHTLFCCAVVVQHTTGGA